MGMKMRDTAMPSRADAWRSLRGLRVSPPGAASTDRARAKTFQMALEQAQQLMDAAESAGHATRPIQLFYALSQAGRAIAAVSTRLPSNTLIPDKGNPGSMISFTVDWRLRGHGVTAPGTSVNRIGKVTVQADWTGLLPGVAAALGCACLAPEDKVKLRDLWPLIWETRFAGGSLTDLAEYPALEIIDETGFPAGLSQTTEANGLRRANGSAPTVLLNGFPQETYKRCSSDYSSFLACLDHYPSLTGWLPATPPSSLWKPAPTNVLAVSWNHPDEAPQPGIRYRGWDLIAVPRVGAMKDALNPFIAWWAVLFALSMMARYEPSNWAGMISIDSSSDANAIENLLDQALGALPHLILEAIDVSAS